MRCLSIHQPWASLIAIGAKRVETRHWETRYRGPVAIHAAKTLRGIDELPGDCEGKYEDGCIYGYIGGYQAWYERGKGGRAYLELGAREMELPLGAVVAVAHLTACVPSEMVLFSNTLTWDGIHLVCPLEEQHFGNYEPGRFGWVLADVTPLAVPIPCRGQQGLFELPADVAAALEARR